MKTTLTTLQIRFKRETADAFALIPTIAFDYVRGRLDLWAVAGRKSISITFIKD